MCQIRSTAVAPSPTLTNEPENIPSKPTKSDKRTETYFSDTVSVNPDGLASIEATKKAMHINRMYDKVFNPDIPMYNGHSGDIQCHINMGPVKPPQRKARIPEYNHEKLVLMQNKFDELGRQGVFVKPEVVGITAEYMNLSFLVQKPSSNDLRLVTAFREIGVENIVSHNHL